MSSDMKKYYSERALMQDQSMWTNLRQVILARRSTRVFSKNTTKIVSPEIVQDILDFGYESSSVVCNPACIRVITITNPEVKERLAEEMKGERQNAPADAKLVFVVLVNQSALVNNRESCLVSAGALIEGMLLRATANGVDSLWLSSFFDHIVTDICGIQSNTLIPIAIICLGFRSKIPRVARRITMEKRSSFERFDPARFASNDEFWRESGKINQPGYLTESKRGKGMCSDLIDTITLPNDYIDTLDQLRQVDNVPSRRNKPLFETSSVIENIQEVVMWAPSAKNFQSPYLIIVRDTAFIKALQAAHGLESDFNMAVIVLGTLERFEMLKKKAKRKVPHYPSTSYERGIKLFVHLDAGAAIQNMSLALLAMGYRPKWILDSKLRGLLSQALNCPDGKFSFHGIMLM